MTSDVLKAFGVELRAARVAAGMTLAQLAEAAFDNPDRKGYVSQVEKGNRKINPLTVGKLAEALDLPDHVTRPMMANDDTPQDDSPTPVDTKAEQMIAAAETEGTPGVGESLLVALAYEYAEGDTTDLQSAYKGLRAALQTAREMAQRSELKDNTDASVAAIRARVDALNRDGEPDAAAEVIDDAIAQKTAEMAAVLDLGVQQDRLRNDPKAAADKLVMGLRLEVAEDALFDALLALWNGWYVTGRDAWLNFEAAVAIHLAQASLTIASDAEQRGVAGNNIGSALGTLGERESGTDRLEDAVAAFRAALQEYTRERMPLDWAMTQMNLGNALRSLGQRENGTERQEEAVAAFRAALQEYTRERVPLDWAMTQMNLGNALQTLGERESSTDRLEEAVAAFRAALQEYTSERVPLDWAMTQMNLGNALRSLGQRESGTERLEEAVEAYHAALQERTEDRVPLQWAMVQANLALLEVAWFDKAPDTARLDAAERYATAALKAFKAAEATYYIAQIKQDLVDIQDRRDALS